MAVTRGITGFEGIAQGLKDLGIGLGNSLFPEQQKLQKLREDPARLQSLSGAFRRAQEAGTTEPFLRSLGAHDEEARARLSEELGSFQPTLQEEINQDFRSRGGVEAQGEATVEGLRTEGLRAREERRAIQPVVDAQIAQALLQGMTIEEAIANNLPALDAAGQREQAIANASEGLYRASYFDVLNESGQYKTVADAERLQALLSQRDSEVRMGQLERYTQAINSIDQSTPEGQDLAFKAAVFGNDPSFGNYLAQRERLSEQARLAQLSTQPTPQESVMFSIEMQEKIDDRLKLLNDPELEKEDRQALQVSLNNIIDLASDLQNNGLMPPIDLVRADIEANELGIEKFESDKVRSDAQLFNERLHSRDPDDDSALPLSLDERIAAVESSLTSEHLDAVMRGYSEKEKRQFTEFLTNTLARLQDRKRLETLGPITASGERRRTGLVNWLEKLETSNSVLTDQVKAMLSAEISRPTGR